MPAGGEPGPGRQWIQLQIGQVGVRRQHPQRGNDDDDDDDGNDDGDDGGDDDDDSGQHPHSSAR